MQVKRPQPRTRENARAKIVFHRERVRKSARRRQRAQSTSEWWGAFPEIRSHEMSKTLHYKSNLRDVFFNLFEVLDVEKNVFGKGPFVSLDGPTAKDTLVQLEKLATNELAASFVDGDRTPLKLDEKTGNVTIPESIKKSLQAWFDNG